MRGPIGTGGLVVWMALSCAQLVAPGADVSDTAGTSLCGACLQVCTAPLSYEDVLLDESTNYYIPDAPRVNATAAAIEMATKLEGIHRDYQAGFFGEAYETHARDIERLAGKQPEVDRATSAEIRSLKRTRAALYADTVVGLQAAAGTAPSQRLLDVYRAKASDLDGILHNLPGRQQMPARERAVVCEVLAAYGR